MVIDMSVCRKIADAVEECRHSKSKSFPSKKGHVLTGSSRKKKSQEKPHEKETSQELQEQREVKDFASNPQG